MAQQKVSMPQSQGGLVRYFDEYKSRIELKPGHVVILCVVVVVLMIILHTMGYSVLG